MRLRRKNADTKGYKAKMGTNHDANTIAAAVSEKARLRMK